MARGKMTGFVRPIDSLGRIVIPKDIRIMMQLSPTDAMEFFVEKDNNEVMVLLRKYVPGCDLCGAVWKLVNFKGHHICVECCAEMSDLWEKQPEAGSTGQE